MKTAIVICTVLLAACQQSTKSPIPDMTGKTAEQVVASLPKIPSVLIVAGKNEVRMQEFTDMSACAEAAVYIKVGTEDRYIAKCVTR